MGNPFDTSRQIPNIMPGLQMFGQGLQRRAEFERERVGEEQSKQLREKAIRVFQSGDPAMMAEFVGKNPGAKDIFSEMIGAKQESMVGEAKRWLIDNEDPVEIHATQAQEKAAAGEDITDDVENVKALVTDPEGERKKREMILAIYDPESFKAYQEQQGIEAPTKEIKEFEYAEKHPKFALQQQKKLNDKKLKDLSRQTFKDSSELRKEFLAQSKDYQKVRDAYTRIQSSVDVPTAPGDLSLIFNYMKMLDPNSVVRESEFAQAANTGAFGERIKAAVGKVQTGKRLSNKMREEFVDTARKLMQGAKTQHAKRGETYTSIAKSNNFPIDQVVVDIDAPEYSGEGELTDEQYNKLPSGATYVEGGKEYRKK